MEKGARVAGECREGEGRDAEATPLATQSECRKGWGGGEDTGALPVLLGVCGGERGQEGRQTLRQCHCPLVVSGRGTGALRVTHLRVITSKNEERISGSCVKNIPDIDESSQGHHDHLGLCQVRVTACVCVMSSIPRAENQA